MSRLAASWSHLVRLLRDDIWQPGALKHSSPRAWLYAILRVISITWTVFNETKAASRAAALSFSSLLGLGPLVALTVLIAGFALDNKDPDLAVNTLSRVMSFVAPQIGQFKHQRRADRPLPPGATAPAAASPAAADSASSAAPGDTPPPPAPPRSSRRAAGERPPSASAADPSAPAQPINPRLVRMMDNFIANGRSGSAGAVGGVSLIFIVLLLFKTVEDSFNEIWGVHRGRTLLTRIVYYWTILTLGAVLFFASIGLLGAGAFLGVFKGALARLPFSAEFVAALQWLLPVFSFAFLVALLTLFYRFVPNVRVLWRAAFAGAMVVASLLVLNNYLTFLYVRRVILTESLYGSLGFPLVVMFGLYIFWLFVLIGGQVGYAVQNVHFRNSQAAWAHLSNASRERLCLVVLLAIARRFHACQPPVTASQLGALVKVPSQILNECLNRLVALQLITPLPPVIGADASDFPYQPARPLTRITLAEFKTRSDHFGDEPVAGIIDRLDPLVLQFNQSLDRLAAQDFFQKNLDELFAEFPYEAARAAAASRPS